MTQGETHELHWKKKKKQDDSHCGSGCYWISVDDFPSPGEDDVVMNPECVRKKWRVLEKVTCIIELIFLSCKAFQPLLYYFEVHCHCFRISSFYQPEIQNLPVEMMEMMTGNKIKSKWPLIFGLASTPPHCALF